jgi:methionyl-tRNA formyltransferase
MMPGPRPFDTVILLTGAAEYAALAAALKGHNPALGVHHAAALAELEAFAPRLLRSARLIGFLTPVVVPRRILDRLGFGAYNFHPGPPNYPGWLPAHFAIYDGITDFGVTAHRMIEKIDAGPIVGVELFAVPPHASIAALEQMAFTQAAYLFWRLAKALATQDEPLAELPIRWSGRKSTRKMIAALCDVPLDIAAAELRRRVAAFGDGDFAQSPTITLHGVQFRYVKPEGKEKTEAPSVAPTLKTESEPV